MAVSHVLLLGGGGYRGRGDNRVDLTRGCYDSESRGIGGKGVDVREGVQRAHDRGWVGSGRAVTGRNGYLSIT